MKLNSLYWLKKEIKQIEEQISELTFLKSSAMSFLPRGNGVSSPVENAVFRIETLCDRLRDKLSEYAIERERIENIIDGIEDDELRLIARMRFVDNLGYKEIGDRMYIDQTTARKRLKKFVDEMDGEKND